MSYKDAQGIKELVTKVTSYTLTDADRGRYIGIEITPTTQTGTPNVGTALHLYDVSTASGGGSDSDNVAPGPVVNQNLKVAIFVDGTSINLINGSTPIELGKTYVAKLYSDENKNGKFDAGTDADVTANYDFRWVLSGSSQQLGTSGGIVNSSFDNNNLVIPATNDEARTNLNGPARDGKRHFPSRPTATGYRVTNFTLFTNTNNAYSAAFPQRECCFHIFCLIPD